MTDQIEAASTDDLPIGYERWHVFDPDSGPSIGIELRLSKRHTLYVGELGERSIQQAPDEVQALRRPGAWWLCLVTDDREMAVMGVVEPDAVRALTDALGAALCVPRT